MEFVQDNHSKSKKGVLRGLHFQTKFTQGKLVRAVKGSVYDVAVDLRKSSETYGQWYGVLLTEQNKTMFYIPEGFAHGFLTLTDNVEFAYKADNYYNKESEGAIRFDDEKIGVDWKLADLGVGEVIVSDKDKTAPGFEELTEDCFF